MKNAIPFAPQGAAKGLKISATSSSSATKINPASGALPGNNVMRVYNAGAVIVYIAFGGSGVVATKDTDIAIPAGGVGYFSCGKAQYIGVITDSSTASVYVMPGEGGI